MFGGLAPISGARPVSNDDSDDDPMMPKKSGGGGFGLLDAPSLTSSRPTSAETPRGAGAAAVLGLLSDSEDDSDGERKRKQEEKKRKKEEREAKKKALEAKKEKLAQKKKEKALKAKTAAKPKPAEDVDVEFSDLDDDDLKDQVMDFSEKKGAPLGGSLSKPGGTGSLGGRGQMASAVTTDSLASIDLNPGGGGIDSLDDDLFAGFGKKTTAPKAGRRAGGGGAGGLGSGLGSAASSAPVSAVASAAPSDDEKDKPFGASTGAARTPGAKAGGIVGSGGPKPIGMLQKKAAGTIPSGGGIDPLEAMDVDSDWDNDDNDSDGRPDEAEAARLERERREKEEKDKKEREERERKAKEEDDRRQREREEKEKREAEEAEKQRKEISIAVEKMKVVDDDTDNDEGGNPYEDSFEAYKSSTDDIMSLLGDNTEKADSKAKESLGKMNPNAPIAKPASGMSSIKEEPKAAESSSTTTTKPSLAPAAEPKKGGLAELMAKDDDLDDDPAVQAATMGGYMPTFMGGASRQRRQLPDSKPKVTKPAVATAKTSDKDKKDAELAEKLREREKEKQRLAQQQKEKEEKERKEREEQEKKAKEERDKATEKNKAMMANLGLDPDDAEEYSDSFAPDSSIELSSASLKITETPKKDRKSPLPDRHRKASPRERHINISPTPGQPGPASAGRDQPMSSPKASQPFPLSKGSNRSRQSSPDPKGMAGTKPTAQPVIQSGTNQAQQQLFPHEAEAARQSGLIHPHAPAGQTNMTAPAGNAVLASPAPGQRSGGYTTSPQQGSPPTSSAAYINLSLAHEEALAKIARLQEDIENEKRTTDMLKTKVSTLTASHHEEISRLRTDYENQLSKVEAQLDIENSDRGSVQLNHREEIRRLKQIHEEETRAERDKHERTLAGERQTFDQQLNSERELADKKMQAIRTEAAEQAKAAAARSQEQLQHTLELHKKTLLEKDSSHAAAMEQLRTAYETQMEQLSSQHSSTEMLSGLARQIHLSSESMGNLQRRLESDHSSVSKTRLDAIAEKEKTLRDQEASLAQRQRMVDEERSRLENMMQSTESSLRDIRNNHEDERQRLAQEHARLEQLQMQLRNEKAGMKDEIDRERRKLEETRTLYFSEREQLLVRMNDEKREIMDERKSMESMRDNINREEVSLKRRQEEVEKVIRQEKAALQEATDSFHLRREQFEREAEEIRKARRQLENDKSNFEIEVKRLTDLALQIQLKSEDVSKIKESTHSDLVQAQAMRDEARTLHQGMELDKMKHQEMQRNLVVAKRDFERERLMLVRDRKSVIEEKITSARALEAARSLHLRISEQMILSGPAASANKYPGIAYHEHATTQRPNMVSELTRKVHPRAQENRYKTSGDTGAKRPDIRGGLARPKTADAPSRARADPAKENVAPTSTAARHWATEAKNLRSDIRRADNELNAQNQFMDNMTTFSVENTSVLSGGNNTYSFLPLTSVSPAPSKWGALDDTSFINNSYAMPASRFNAPVSAAVAVQEAAGLPIHQISEAGNIKSIGDLPPGKGSAAATSNRVASTQNAIMEEEIANMMSSGDNSLLNEIRNANMVPMVQLSQTETNSSSLSQSLDIRTGANAAGVGDTDSSILGGHGDAAGSNSHSTATESDPSSRARRRLNNLLADMSQ